MNSRPEDGAGPVQVAAGADGPYSVDARGGVGVQVGEGNTQIIYTYNRLTWTDGVAPPPLASVSGAVDSPYRGLGAFEEQDAAFFFGREEAATQVLDRMSRLADSAGLLVVSGVSGAGKSSLLRAGVLPRIRGAGLASAPGAASWPCLVFTPGRAPLDELALRVAALAGADAAAVRRGLDADPGGFALTARQAALAPPPVPGAGPGRAPTEPAGPAEPTRRRLLLVVDQFEQIFTQCGDDAQRQAFIAALCAAADPGPDHAPAALVVLGVRADFEARCANYPGLAGPVQDRYLVTAMTARQLRMAITEPAKTAGSRVDDDLVEVLLGEMQARHTGAAGPGVLPLLSHALDQAWRSRTGMTLTLADYERTGGIEGAVADSAQHAYDRLTPAQQAAARQVFTQLTAASSDGIDTADRATRAELTGSPSVAGAGDVEAVLEAFAAERLLTLAADSVEISHEVLLTAWPLLRDTWLAETHADRIVRTRLHHVAADWARGSRDPSYLYSGSLLEAATETAARIGADPARNPPLNQTERDFLGASHRARHATVRRRRAVIAGLLALTLVAVVAAGFAVSNAANAHRQASDAVRQAANAARQHAIALSRLLAADALAIATTEPVTARRFAVAAWQVSPTQQAGSALTTMLAEQQQDGILPAGTSRVNGLAFSPVGQLLASAYADGTVRLWDTATGQSVRTLQSGSTSVNGVAFSPEGKLLASADGDGTVKLWDPATGQSVRTLESGSTDVNAVAFSFQGLLASADGDGTVKLWNPATGVLVRTIRADTPGRQNPADANGVAFSSNGTLLATADADGTVKLWNAATGGLVRKIQATIANAPLGVNAVAISADGQLLATGDQLSDAPQLWDPATGQPAAALQGGTDDGTMDGVAFGPVGELVATVYDDGTVTLWDPVTGRLVRTIQPAGTGLPLDAGGHPLPVGNAVAFGPGGELLASADADGTVRLWNSVTGQPVSTIPADTTGLNIGVNAVAFGPGGMPVASADADGTLRLWDPVTGRFVATIQADTVEGTSVNGVAFRPGGKLLASAYSDGTVRLLDMVTGRFVRTIPAATAGQGTAAAGQDTEVNGVAFSPGGELVASAADDGLVKVWDPVTGQLVSTMPADTAVGVSGVYGVAFSRDGALLASADVDGTVKVWNMVTGKFVRAIQANSTGAQVIGVNGVAFGPAGLLASADGDGTVRLWNLVTGQRVRTIQADTPGAQDTGVNGVAFSPNGELLASADGDGTVRLWNPVTGQAVSTIQADTPGRGTGVNAVAFSPDGKLMATADADGTVRLWDVSLFTDPYQALCADVGLPTRQEWNEYASGEPRPKVCS